MKLTVFLNGKFIPEEEAKLSVSTPGFLYGWGLFETMRFYNNRIVYLRQHLQRIKRSCQLMEIKFPYTINGLKAIIGKTVKINNLQDAYVRLTLWKSSRGADILVATREYHPYSAKKYRSGFHAHISIFKQNESSLLAHLKTTNCLLYRLAYAKARNHGFDEAIILNGRGYIAEGSRSNIFLVKKKEVFTPSLECGCLGGITRRVVLDLAKKHNILIGDGKLTPSDLYAADEAFLTNSLMGVMPLTAIGKERIKQGLAGNLTRFLMVKYNLCLKYGT